MTTGSLQARFWGVRGSMPSASADTLGYGGNTSCVEVFVPGEASLVFDAGSGIRSLGRSLQQEDTHVFLSHFHLDHISGLPYFRPLFEAGRSIHFHASGPGNVTGAILSGLLSPPYVPLSLSETASNKEFLEISCPIRIGSITICPFPLNHPQGAVGYRIESSGSTIVYATDFEHGDAAFDAKLREYSEGADILVCDAQYTPEEFERFRGWGHTTWLEATKVARDAHVRRLLLFHHDIARSDDELDGIVEAAKRCFENCDAAREGSVAGV